MKDNLQKNLQIIKEKLISLRQKDKKYKVFGSGEQWGGHHYRLNPKLKEETLVELEKKYQIVLPEDYREFVKVIGNGGVGPSYGLIALFKSFDGKNSEIFNKGAFPYNNKDAQEIINKRAEEKASGLPDWEGSFLVLNAKGYLNLASYGCGEYAILIIDGDQHGKVWYRYEKKAYPYYVKKNGKISQLNFLDWYDAWLTESLNSFPQATGL